MLGDLLLRQLVFTAESLDARLQRRHPHRFRGHLVRRVRCQWRHHVLECFDARTAVGVFGGGEAFAAGVLVQGEDVILAHRARFQRDRRAAQQGVGGFHRAQFFKTAPFDFEIGAGVTHDAVGTQVQEGRTAGLPAMLHRAQHVGVACGQVQSIGKEVVEVGTVLEVLRNPAARRFHRDADAVVLAHVQHRRGQFLIGRPRGGIECGLCRCVIAGGIAETANGDAVIGNRQRMPNPLGGLDGHCRAQCLGQVRGNRRSLWQHPQGLAAPHFMAATAGRVFGAGGKAQR